MLKKFTVKNYKNFKQPISIDFSKIGDYDFNTDCISDSIITKLLIYGRNATGKTNLGAAVMDIQQVLFGTIQIENNVFLNADSDEETAEFSYEFKFGKDVMEYSYRLDENRILYTEKLWINGCKAFDIDFSKGAYDVDLKKIHAEMVIIDIYQKTIEEFRKQGIEETHLSFLRWLLNNTVFSSSSLLFQLHSYVRGMRLQSIRFSSQNIQRRSSFKKFYEQLVKNENLKLFERFLNMMGIKCELVIETLPDGSRELYFKHNVLLPFIKNASSGTVALMNLYISLILPMAETTFFYMDEFDAFFHYEMSDYVIRYVKEYYPKCQIIMTTHFGNSSAMRQK